MDKVQSQFRRVCMALPETAETGSFGHPNFRAGKRTFAAFEWIKGRPTLACRVGTDEAQALLMSGRQFFSTPYGRGLWVSLWADERLDWQLVETLVEQSYRQVALKRMLSKLDSSAGTADTADTA